MQIEKQDGSKHFTLERLADGVYACVHKQGGAAFSNVGIIDLGDRTLVVDAFDTLAAGRDLRHAAETLFGRPVDTLILTHPHSDHWKGASAFDAGTTLLASKITRKVTLKWGKGMMRDYKNVSEWEAWLEEMEGQLETEEDKSVRKSLENSILRTRYTVAEIPEYQPRYADETFEDEVTFQGKKRNAVLRSYGNGHSEDDAVLFLEGDSIAFIGDIGFFDTQPFLPFGDINRHREQLQFFLASDYRVLVPGHGPVGYTKDYVNLQIQYLDAMVERVGEVVRKGESFEKAMEITLPEPFDRWLVGGRARFEANVRYLYAHFGGKLPKN